MATTGPPPNPSLAISYLIYIYIYIYFQLANRPIIWRTFVRLVTRLTVGLRGFTLSLHLRACLVCKYICNFLFIYFFCVVTKKKKKKKRKKTEK
jgi:hypothetical protein